MPGEDRFLNILKQLDDLSACKLFRVLNFCRVLR